MWFRKVRAGAFGYLRGETLEFRRGLNIVYGLNESGKSTWHDAITVALCGRRHGSGRTKEERAFKRRRQPWDDSDRWGVTLEAQLDDGRIVEIDRDLSAPRTTILDIGMGGREVTDDLMNQGSPDGAKWLGLDRTTFPMTASVGQASILAVTVQADALQEHLARAATGGAGDTAAAAIERIENFVKENIGLDRINARRPLRLAMNAVEKAESQLSGTSKRRRAYLDLAAIVDENRREVHRLERRQAAIEALVARNKAERLANSLGEQVTRLEEWERRFPDGDPEAVGEVSTTELVIAINGARNAPKSVATDLEPLEVLMGRSEMLGWQRDWMEALKDWEEVEERAEELRKEVERLEEWGRRFPDGDPQNRELISFTDIASAIARCNSLPVPGFTDIDPMDVLQKRITMLDQSSPKPCPSPGDVQRWVIPLREPAPSSERKLKLQIEEARNAERLSQAPPAAGKKLALPVVLGIAAAAIVSVTTEWIYGIVTAVVVVAGSMILRAGLSSREPASAIDIERLERQLEERKTYEARVAEAHRSLQEWELPLDADAAIAEFYNRERAWSEHSADRKRLEELVARRRRFEEGEARRRAGREQAFGELRRVVDSYGGDASGDEGEVVGVATFLLADLERLARDRQQHIAEWGRFQEARGGRSVEEWRVEADSSLQDVEEARLKADSLDAGFVEEFMRLGEIEAEQRRLEDLVGQRRRYDDEETRRRVEREETFGELRNIVGSYGGDVSGDENQVLRAAADLLSRQEDRQQKQRQDIGEWGRFQEALGGRSVEEWLAEAEYSSRGAEEAQRRADKLKAGLDDEPLPSEHLAIEGQKTGRLIHEARKEASRTGGQLEQIDAASVDVAAAEASLHEAETELDRVRHLQKTLDTAKEHLQAAAEHAHRLLAPKLEALISEWIPIVTQGRYVDALVDPETLQVRMRTAGGAIREAEFVSHGTSEQVYLVLRMILAQVLTDGHERCPILLDDPTVNADVDRKKEMLEYLLRTSENHQVILFTQDESVVRWARNRVNREKIKLMELPAPVVV